MRCNAAHQFVENYLSIEQERVVAVLKSGSRDFAHLSSTRFIPPETRAYVPAVMAVYRLKNQEGMESFAGMKVEVTGTLDPKTETIDNTAVALAASAHGANR